MSTIETIFLLICGAAALHFVFMPSKRGGNVNPPPTGRRPPAPLPPPAAPEKKDTHQ